MSPEQQTPSHKNKLQFSLDLRVIVALLLVVIIGMLLLWQPWQGTGDDRTVTVNGQTTIKAVPDEFVFNPSYQFKNVDKDVALRDLTAKSETVVAELKKLGVEESKIKTNSGGYGVTEPRTESDETTYTLNIAVTVGKRELAQKVQDYLLTTSPTGAVTPQATFSDAKRRELEDKARDQATKDARTKADQLAKNLGFSVGKVKEINDNSGFGIPYRASDTAESKATQLTLQPGENELTYTVSVVYYVR